MSWKFPKFRQKRWLSVVNRKYELWATGLSFQVLISTNHSLHLLHLFVCSVVVKIVGNRKIGIITRHVDYLIAETRFEYNFILLHFFICMRFVLQCFLALNKSSSPKIITLTTSQFYRQPIKGFTFEKCFLRTPSHYLFPSKFQFSSWVVVRCSVEKRASLVVLILNFRKMVC